ncbi:MAG: ankyrin repeat domain-containing protein [Bosea sp.]|uniref:ankyrin repeat domain-containing protein n=1 Tax=Bosea sp. (in: a-proteobacteria) TaxID=1871050 RepID=UPI00239CF280|nr:ankyrin repeat domain-containing protein [Bosea sp. (in: a-proteobacteria)]MCP4734546.1 ankyrin repeat domain-containing protein [Bosea sp. (in: a-proteobacteria)]
MGDKSQLDPRLVQDFVRAAHGNLEQVTTLISEHPTLVNAAWDWGGGDWESGLGAAAHTGRREIAEFLLARGARMDVFAAAMLGHLDLVRTHLAVVPDALTAAGPHGIPLLAHAKMGGEPARPVLDYLQGLLDGRVTIAPAAGATKS